MTNKKLNFISYAYAIGAILVLLGHSVPNGEQTFPMIVDDMRTYIYCIHMPLFFFIAGFLLQHTVGNNPRPFKGFIINKVVKFLVPYTVLSVLTFLPKVLLSNYVNDDVALSPAYFVYMMIVPRANVWGHFWFLPTLLNIYLISYFLLRCSKSKICTVIVTAVCAALAAFPIPTDLLALKDMSQQLIYFWIGILACKFLFGKYKKLLDVRVALVAIAASVIVFITGMNYRYTCGWMAIKELIAFIMLYALITFSVLIAEKGSRLLDYFEGKTFSIYILSWPAQAVTEIVLNRILHMHWLISFSLMFIIGFAFPLFVVFCYKKLIKRFGRNGINRFLGLLIGYS